MNLRELRLYHWKKALTLRAKGDDRRASVYSSKVAHEKANFHIRAVQALNDVVAGTAEDDAKYHPQYVKDAPLNIELRKYVRGVLNA